jgi:hypothetical protein
MSRSLCKFNSLNAERRLAGERAKEMLRMLAEGRSSDRSVESQDAEDAVSERERHERGTSRGLLEASLATWPHDTHAPTLFEARKPDASNARSTHRLFRDYSLLRVDWAPRLFTTSRR